MAKAATKPEDNMALWEQVCETDPDTTKLIEFGKRRFHTIDAQSQLKRCTALWGPYGATWGLRALKWGEIRSGDGTVVEITLEAEFWYPGGAFPTASDIKFVVGGECRKKVWTDCLTKSLSRVGVNSDVFEGRFDDNRYVAEMRAKYAKPAPTAAQPPPATAVPASQPTTPATTAAAPPAKPSASQESVRLYTMLLKAVGMNPLTSWSAVGEAERQQIAGHLSVAAQTGTTIAPDSIPALLRTLTPPQCELAVLRLTDLVAAAQEGGNG